MHFSRFDLEPMQIYVQKNIRKYLFKFGIFFSKLFWFSVRKKNFNQWEKVFKIENEDQVFANVLRLLEKSRTSETSEQFLKQNYFLTNFWSFLRFIRTIRIQIEQNNWDFIQFRKMHFSYWLISIMIMSFIFLQVCTTLLWNQVKYKMETY